MNILLKRYKALMVMAVIVTAVVLVVKAESASATSLQNPKPANTSVKAARKHIITPNLARNFLNDLDMPTRDYSDTWGANKYGKYQASSDSFKLETRDFNRYQNNISYSVFGDKFIAKAVELDLAVNDLSFSSNAINEFTKYSDKLMYKVTAKNLTPQIKKAIQTKTNGQWVINGYKIKLTKEIFPDEKITKGVEPTSDHGAFSLTFLIEL